jgi:hypothetical protein
LVVTASGAGILGVGLWLRGALQKLPLPTAS